MQGCGETDPRRKAVCPLIVLPIAPSVPSCSKLSRYGLASSEHAARLARRPTLTAPARDDVSEPAGPGQENGLWNEQKKLRKTKNFSLFGNPLQKKAHTMEHRGEEQLGV